MKFPRRLTASVRRKIRGAFMDGLMIEQLIALWGYGQRVMEDVLREAFREPFRKKRRRG